MRPVRVDRPGFVAEKPIPRGSNGYESRYVGGHDIFSSRARTKHVLTTFGVPPEGVEPESMIRKNGYRFYEKIVPKQKDRAE